MIDEEIRRLILKEVDASRLRELARQKGMRTLLEDGIDKVRARVTTISEVLRVTQEV